MKPWHPIRAAVGATLLAMPLQFLSLPVSAAGTEITISHYFTGDLGLAGIKAYFDEYKKEAGVTVVDSPIGMEDFKTGILVRASANSLPDVFSYWAGARTQFLVNADKLAPIDEMWSKEGLDSIVAKPIADAATMYNGHRYLVPLGFHYAGFFYNPKVMKEAGITEMPKTWDGLLGMCKTLKAKGVDTFALGSKNRWPAQFWFDYLLLRTAGAQYRADLNSGKASWTDPQVAKAMSLWKQLFDQGCFAANSNANDWTDAADEVARGDAAITLMGTWVTGYWNGNGLKPIEDYDVFPFPQLDASIPDAAVGVVDGIVMAKNSAQPDAARGFLALIIKNKELQANWAKVQGALAPNVDVDPSIYTPVQKKALDIVKASPVYAFNYDLATPPAVAEVGLNMYQKFVNDPSNVDGLMAETQAAAADAFKK
jgi:ABC-type glycerol-3-phosphate transport system substrate-binding protein